MGTFTQSVRRRRFLLRELAAEAEYSAAKYWQSTTECYIFRSRNIMGI